MSGTDTPNCSTERGRMRWPRQDDESHRGRSYWKRNQYIVFRRIGGHNMLRFANEPREADE